MKKRNIIGGLVIGFMIIVSHQFSMRYFHQEMLERLDGQGIAFNDASNVGLTGISGVIILSGRNLLPGFNGQQSLKVRYDIDGMSYPIQIKAKLYTPTDEFPEFMTSTPQVTDQDGYSLLIDNMSGFVSAEQAKFTATIDGGTFALNSLDQVAVGNIDVTTLIHDTVITRFSTPHVTLLKNNGVNVSFDQVQTKFIRSNNCAVLCDANYAISIGRISHNDISDPNFYIKGLGLDAVLSGSQTENTHIFLSSEIEEIAYKNNGARTVKNSIGIRNIKNSSLAVFLDEISQLKNNENPFFDQNAASVAYARLLSGGASVGLLSEANFDDDDSLYVDLFMQIKEHSNLVNNPLELLNTLDSKLNIKIPTKTAIHIFGMQPVKNFIQSEFGVLSNNDFMLSSSIEISEGAAIINGKRIQI